MKYYGKINDDKDLITKEYADSVVSANPGGSSLDTLTSIKIGDTSYEIKGGTSNGVTNVAYDSTNKKLTQTKNGSTSDIVSVSTIKSDLSLSKSDVGLDKVNNTAITVTSTSVSDGTNTFNKYTLPSDIVAVSANPTSTTATLTGITIGSTSYKVEASGGGNVDDVKVNGTSVVTDKVAEITVATVEYLD